MEDGEFAKALKDANHVLASQPNDVELLAMRSQLRHHVGEHRLAVEDCKKMLELKGMNGGPMRANYLNA